MAGLLGGDFDDPRTQGLLGFGLAALAGGGPSTQRRSAGQILGAAGLSGLQQYRQAEALQREKAQQELMARLRQAQIAETLAQAKQREALAARGIDDRTPADILSALQYQQRYKEATGRDLPFPEAYAITRRESRVVDIGGVPTVQDPTTREWTPIVPVDSLLENIRKTTGTKERTEQEIKAQYDLIPATDSSGLPTFTTRLREVQSRGLAPPAGGRFPSGYGDQNARIKLLEEELARANKPEDRAALQREIDAARRGVQAPMRPLDASKPRIAEETARSKAQVARETGAPQKISALTRAAERIESIVLPALDRAAKNVSLVSSGFGGAILDFPGFPARDLQRALDEVTSHTGFSELQNMRFESPTGGALGQVAVQELMMLQRTMGSLDKDQSPGVLRQQIESVRKRYEKAVQKLRRAIEIEEQYLQDRGRWSSEPPVLKYNPETGELE